MKKQMFNVGYNFDSEGVYWHLNKNYVAAPAALQIDVLEQMIGELQVHLDFLKATSRGNPLPRPATADLPLPTGASLGVSQAACPA